MECRPIGDLGLINGGIPDESITVSSSENGYTRTVNIYIYIHIDFNFEKIKNISLLSIFNLSSCSFRVFD